MFATRVEDGKAAVGICREFQIICSVRPGRIGDKFWRSVVRRSRFFRKMQLPKSGEIWRRLDDVQRRRAAAFGRSVIDDGNARRNWVYESGAAALVEAMVGCDVDAHVPDFVDRAHQFTFLVGSEITEIENLELAEGDERAERTWIFGFIGWRLRRTRARGIGLTSAGKGLLENGAIGGDDFGGNSLYGENVPGLCDDAFIFSGGQELLIGEPALLCYLVRGFTILSVIDEGADWNPLGELRSAANVVVMVMGDEDEVDFVNAGIMRSSDDAVGVTTVIARPTGIDEERLARGSDEERGLTAFDVHKIYL